jgi:hypothetical protein
VEEEMVVLITELLEQQIVVEVAEAMVELLQLVDMLVVVV